MVGFSGCRFLQISENRNYTKTFYVYVFLCVAHQPGVLEEIIHNLDYCDVLVLGEELNPDQESLQLQRSSLLGKHLDATNSTSGMSIYGMLTMLNEHPVCSHRVTKNTMLKQPSAVPVHRCRLHVKL